VGERAGAVFLNQTKAPMLESPTPDRKATVLLLLVIAGCVDAVGLAELSRYFVSYMSGNITQIGLLLAYRDFAGVALPAGLVALFVAGATIGTMIVEKTGRAAAAVLLLVEAALIACAWAGLGSASPMTGIVVLPVAMGLANIVTLSKGGSSPGTTYATGALVKLGIALAGLGGRERTGAAVGFNLASFAALLTGSFAGGFGRLSYGAGILLAPVAALTLLGIADLVLALRRR
jgi:uncharacterized membrane protein YoaK (UPF0700 family)